MPWDRYYLHVTDEEDGAQLASFPLQSPTSDLQKQVRGGTWTKWFPNSIVHMTLT